MAAMCPCVALAFGFDCMEVDASLAEKRGSLRALAREAENKWDLQPGTFSFMGSSGKVDSALALQHELMAAGSGSCKIEVLEHLEGKMMREMRKAVQACEDRMLIKLEASIANVQRDLQLVDTKVSGGLAPMVQCLALEQMELRDLARANAKASRILAPMVQCIALEQMELRNKISAGALSIPIDDTMTHIHELSMGDRCSMPEKVVDADAMKTLSDVEKELEQDCVLQAVCDLQKAAQDDLERLRMEVCSLEGAGKVPDPKVDMQTSPCTLQRQCEQPPQQPSHLDSYPKIADARLSWAQPPVTGFAYSNKAIAAPASLRFDAQWRKGKMCSGFHASSDVPHLLSANRACWNSRSMPLLPPLR